MNYLKTPGKIALFFLLLPLFLIVDVFKSQRSILRKIGYVFLTLLVFVWIWWIGFSEIANLIKFTSYEVGITDTLTKLPVSGTSMLPTIKDGSEIELRSPKKYGLERGDIVSFNNNETGGLNYLKRIVGLAGEEFSIKNGSVFINGKALSEPYTLNNLPTYGNTSLVECEIYKIPENNFILLGDNRTVSSDSRVVGFVDENDIGGVIKTKTKTQFETDAVQKEITKVTLNPEVFLKKLNEARGKNKASNLVTHSTLNQLAAKRSQQITENFNDWKNKSIPADKLLEDNGYRFNQIHEYVTFGYLDEQAILDQIFDSKTEKDQFLSNQYTEVGIGLSEKTNKECTFPVVSVILSWPAVPTYEKSVIDSWAREIGINTQSLSNLQTWVGYPEVDQEKLRTLINKIAQMQQIATRIYNKEKGQEWLTQKDYQDIDRYDQMIKEVEALDKELFGKFEDVQGITTTNNATRRF